MRRASLCYVQYYSLIWETFPFQTLCSKCKSGTTEKLLNISLLVWHKISKEWKVVLCIYVIKVLLMSCKWINYWSCRVRLRNIFVQLLYKEGQRHRAMDIGFHNIPSEMFCTLIENSIQKGIQRTLKYRRLHFNSTMQYETNCFTIFCNKSLISYKSL